jgi:histidine ammonia-lyase
MAPGVEAARAAVRAVTPHWDDDQVLHPALVAVGALVRAGGLPGTRTNAEAW